MKAEADAAMQEKDTNDLAAYLFHQGTNYRAYEYLGVHRCGDRFLFRVWAPNADSVSVCGDFNEWSSTSHPMHRASWGGVWEASLPASLVSVGQCYKYCIQSGERKLFKADPYATRMQTPPETASVIGDTEGYTWRDGGWMRYRKGRFDRAHVMQQPLNIYELHVGSWRKKEDGSSYSYSELAGELAPYLKQMGYTHVELMPLAEHPFEGSWGYQICGHYAPTSRYGEERELMAFVDGMHEAGIGVILDWVPAHFPKDAHGLYEFDGQPLYEYRDASRREHRGWGTCMFDVGRAEVQSFLISNAVYWLEKYHVDGLRVDAVASMLYLDCDKRAGEWTPNVYGDNRCLEAIAFFQRLNTYLAGNYPDVMTIAEESSAYAGVTGFADGGLGFSLKWNMGWMNDSLAYLATHPSERIHAHNRMNFSITYAFSEQYVLPVSHDEVVHGKRSLLGRSQGEYGQKFADVRTYLTYLMTHPGKKLTFMGCELGTFCEWDHTKALEWFLLDYDMHRRLQLFTARLNHFYLEHAQLWEKDADPDGFCWIDPDNAAQSVLSYRRRDGKGRELIVLLNFSAEKRERFLVGVPFEGTYREVFNTDGTEFGGTGCCNAGERRSVPSLLRGYAQAVEVTLPAASAIVLECVRRAPNRRRS